jgi:hypothetical protein
MDRKFFRTGLKPGQNEDFWTYWGWSILVPACPGWVGSTELIEIVPGVCLCAP